MSKPVTRPESPAFAYGRFLGEFQRAMETVAVEMARGFAAAASTTRQEFVLTPAQASERVYRARIAQQRVIGLLHVEREADRVRRELGLTP